MTDRGGRWSGAPIRRVEPASGHADPTDGRHAFDQDAALTPIFTTLRRGAWRRPHLQPVPPSYPPQAGPGPHSPQVLPHRPVVRSVPPVLPPPAPVLDAMTRFCDDPLTAPLPIVPPSYAEHAPAPYRAGPPMDRYAAESSTEATAWWRIPTADVHGPTGAPFDGDHDDIHEHADAYDRGDAHHRGPSYDPVYDPADDDTWYEPAIAPGPRHDPTPYPPEFGNGPRYAPPAFPNQVRYDPAYDEPVRYDARRRHRRSVDPLPYDPVTDSGRHHRRLAPAGW